MKCRFCKTELTYLFIDLFHPPASNSFLTGEQLNEPETYFPLKVFTCPECFLVQIDEYKNSGDIFSQEYAYFSSYSSSWLAHAKDYTKKMINRFGINQNCLVIEIASNDGYLLQYFKDKNVPVLGVEPSKNTADVARQKGIESINEFFGTRLAREMIAKDLKANLLIGNNVLAHVPDIVDFVAGLKLVLKEDGIITMEFPHLMQLIENNQFDTIYHEHFSYLSFYSVQKIFKAQQLEIFDVEEIRTHGGSIRIYAKHKDDPTNEISRNVVLLLEKENQKGITDLNYYSHFSQKAFQVKLAFTTFLITQKKLGKKVAAYGAAAKGNTLLNYCGIKNDLIEYVVDASPHKQNKFLPGSHIPVVNEPFLKNDKPDYVVIFPWNLKEEISQQLRYIRNWNGKFVTAVPSLEIF